MNRSELDRAPSALPPLRERLAQRLAHGDVDLPLLQGTSTEVLSVCNDASCDAGRLATLVQRDQALAVHTLKVANSTAYAPREPIVSLQQAISRLGFRTICDIAVAVALKAKVFALPGQEARLQHMWAHSAASGAWAKEIARQRRRNVEGAFLCGLLHDVGQPLVLQALIELDEVAADDADIDQLVHEFHADVGARVLERWNLSAWTCAAARFHHDPDAAGEHVEFARTTQLADLLAHASEHPDGDADAVLKTHPVLADLGLYADEIDALFERRDDVQRIVDSFG